MEVRTEALGSRHDVVLKVAQWDGAAAAVDLSVACLFGGEPSGVMLTGGLLHLDAALHGELVCLRTAGVFRADFLDTLLIATPPATISAKKILVLGLGDPSVWSPPAMARVAAHALHTAVQLGAASAAFAPGIADSGITADQATGLPDALMRGVIEALDAEYALVGLGLAPPIRLRSWTFDAGIGHFDGAVAGFRSSLAAFSKREAEMFQKVPGDPACMAHDAAAPRE